MAGTGIMVGYIHPHTHPHTQLKKSGTPRTHIQSMWDSPLKRERVRIIPTGAEIYLSFLLKN